MLALSTEFVIAWNALQDSAQKMLIATPDTMSATAAQMSQQLTVMQSMLVAEDQRLAGLLNPPILATSNTTPVPITSNIAPPTTATATGDATMLTFI